VSSKLARDFIFASKIDNALASGRKFGQVFATGASKIVRSRCGSSRGDLLRRRFCLDQEVVADFFDDVVGASVLERRVHDVVDFLFVFRVAVRIARPSDAHR
jgi:hypothetical protein